MRNLVGPGLPPETPEAETVEREIQQQVVDTKATDRAERLAALRAHPGYADLVDIGLDVHAAAYAALTGASREHRDEAIGAIKAVEALFQRLGHAVTLGEQAAARTIARRMPAVTEMRMR